MPDKPSITDVAPLPAPGSRPPGVPTSPIAAADREAARLIEAAGGRIAEQLAAIARSPPLVTHASLDTHPLPVLLDGVISAYGRDSSAALGYLAALFAHVIRHDARLVAIETSLRAPAAEAKLAEADASAIADLRAKLDGARTAYKMAEEHATQLRVERDEALAKLAAAEQQVAALRALAARLAAIESGGVEVSDDDLSAACAAMEAGATDFGHRAVADAARAPLLAEVERLKAHLAEAESHKRGAVTVADGLAEQIQRWQRATGCERPGDVRVLTEGMLTEAYSGLRGKSWDLDTVSHDLFAALARPAPVVPPGSQPAADADAIAPILGSDADLARDIYSRTVAECAFDLPWSMIEPPLRDKWTAAIATVVRPMLRAARAEAQAAARLLVDAMRAERDEANRQVARLMVKLATAEQQVTALRALAARLAAIESGGPDIDAEGGLIPTDVLRSMLSLAAAKARAPLLAEVEQLKAHAKEVDAECEFRVDAENRMRALLDAAQEEIARLTKPGPASDDGLLDAAERANRGLPVNASDIDGAVAWLRAVYNLGLAHGRAEQAAADPDSLIAALAALRSDLARAELVASGAIPAPPVERGGNRRALDVRVLTLRLAPATVRDIDGYLEPEETREGFAYEAIRRELRRRAIDESVRYDRATDRGD